MFYLAFGLIIFGLIRSARAFGRRDEVAAANAFGLIPVGIMGMIGAFALPEPFALPPIPVLNQLPAGLAVVIGLFAAVLLTAYIIRKITTPATGSDS